MNAQQADPIARCLLRLAERGRELREKNEAADADDPGREHNGGGNEDTND